MALAGAGLIVWIARRVWDHTLGSAARLQELLVATREAYDQLQKRYDVLQTKLDQSREVEAQAKIVLASREATFDTLRLQLNEFRLERGVLLQKLYGITLTVPTIEKSPTTIPPGTDFNDMGDARAQMEGLADMHDLDPLKDRAE